MYNARQIPVKESAPKGESTFELLNKEESVTIEIVRHYFVDEIYISIEI